MTKYGKERVAMKAVDVILIVCSVTSSNSLLLEVIGARGELGTALGDVHQPHG